MGNEQIKKITSSHWGAFEAIIENGKLISTKPFEEDLNPNDISKFIPKAVYHEKRVKSPHIRKGWFINKETRNKNLRGDDEFQEVPWDAAIEIAAEEISRVKE